MSKIYNLLKSSLALGVFVAGMNVAAAADFPAAGEFDGTYSFQANTFHFNEEYNHFSTALTPETDYSPYFKADFNFEIKTEGGQVIIYDFPYKGIIRGSWINPVQGIPTTYDRETGTLTLQVLSMQPDPNGIYFGLAPGGEWKGISMSTGNLLKIQIGENGTINIPDFDVITYSGANVTATVANYSDITVTDGNDDGEGGKPGDENDPVDGNDYSFLEGVWTFPDLWSVVSNSLIRNDEKEPPTYNAVVTGNTVTFIDNGSGFNMVARIIDSTTLEFRYRPVGNPAIYTYYQCPFINNSINSTNYNTATLDENVTFQATYNATTHEIIFPEGSGLRFGAFNNVGKLANNTYEEVVRFDGPAIWAAYTPQITLNSVKVVENEEGVLKISFDLTTAHFEEGIELTYKGQLTDHYSDVEAEEDWDIITTFDATVNGNSGTAEASGFEAGLHIFSFNIIAYTSDEEVYAVSSIKDFTITIVKSTADQNGIDNIETTTNSPARYFNLQGVEISHPSEGQIVIKVEDSKVSKIIIR